MNLLDQLVTNRDAANSDGLQQGRNSGRIAGTAHQHQVNSNIQFRILARQRHRVVKGGACGHQRSGSEYPVPMGMYDALVDVASEAEIIGVRYEEFQNRPSLMRRNFFGLARKSFISRCISRVAPFKLSYSC